jgi:hypothetical protein
LTKDVKPFIICIQQLKMTDEMMMLSDRLKMQPGDYKELIGLKGSRIFNTLNFPLFNVGVSIKSQHP